MAIEKMRIENSASALEAFVCCDWCWTGHALVLLVYLEVHSSNSIWRIFDEHCHAITLDAEFL